MATPSLLGLPPEMLLRVSSYLTTPELGYLRLTCKHIETNLFDSFAREFFTKRQYMLEHPSLQALVDIANHPTLASYLSEVILSTHVLILDNLETIEKLKAAGFTNRRVLVSSGEASELLVEAFTKLRNLQTIGLRDYDGRGRYRDGEDAHWRSYGWSFCPTSNGNRRVHLGIEDPSNVMVLLLATLAKAKARPRHFHVFLRHHRKLRPSCLDVLDGRLGSEIAKVLANVKELMLAICWEPPMSISRVPSEAVLARSAEPLQRFLAQTIHLETLRLNVDPYEYEPCMLSWLRDARVQNPQPLSNLRRLDLGRLWTKEPVLTAALTNPRLEIVNLWKIELEFDGDANEPSVSGCWCAVLRTLAAANRQACSVQKFEIGYPYECHRVTPDRDGWQIAPVFFHHTAATSPSSLPENKILKATFDARYNSDFAGWLDDLAGRVRKFMPVEGLETGSDEGHEGEHSEGSHGENDDDDD